MSKRVNVKNDDYLRVLYNNNATYDDYLERFTKIATSIFVWKNLPESMDGEYLELCLFLYGEASLLKSRRLGFINTKCATSSYLNIYGLPTQLNCFSYGFQSLRRVYNGDNPTSTEYNECIHVLNNRRRIPTVHSIQLFVERLCDAELTASVNINAQKTPWLIVGDAKEMLTLKNLYTQVASNTPVIFGSKDQINLDKIKCIKTDAPFIADKVMQYKKEIWNEALTFLGINNIMVDKRERLITDEANQNNELINLNLQAFLKPRQLACEQFNKKFNLTGDKAISVEVNSDLENIIKSVLSSVNEYVDDKVTYDVTDRLNLDKEGVTNE